MRSVPKRAKGNSRAVISPAAKRLTCALVIHAGTETKICNKDFLRPEHLNRHMLTVHGEHKEWICKLPGCQRCFSRADNLSDHYWTHLDKGDGRGRNVKWSLEELKSLLPPDEVGACIRLGKRLHQYRALARNSDRRRGRKSRSR